jgi:hypothetical protein
VIKLATIQAYYDGSVFVPLVPVKAKLNQPALITILEVSDMNANGHNYVAYFGALSAESYAEIIEALQDTERVDVNEW